MKAMSRLYWAVSLAVISLTLCDGAVGEDFEPHVLVYAGRIPGYAEALAEIIEETGTKVIVANSDAIIRSLTVLPQTGCIVIAATNPSDFVFLREFAPAFQEFFEEGGSFVGLSASCSMALEPLATTIFPIMGNSTGRGKKVGEDFGSTYVLSEGLEEITGGLPESFVLTQEKFTYHSGLSGPLEPTSDVGEVKVLYREEGTGIPLVVALEAGYGGRSVSISGCYIVAVDRLPFYWERLVMKEEFRELLKRSVVWAMGGSGRFNSMYSSIENVLKEEADRLAAIEEAGEESRSRLNQGRILLLAGLWTAALIFQGFLVVRFIAPKLRSRAE